ncbi:MAG: radical SAM family heme chaperone HemW [Oscillospiraceae bacterium]
MNNLGIYIHLPFCIKKCLYCNFYSLFKSKEDIDNYCQLIVETIQLYPFDHKIVDTVYFGGGTPILAGERNIGKILEAINKRFSLSSAEITLEANPAYTLDKKLKSYKELGINRISFGVQSLDDNQLKTLGRSHTANEAISTLEAAVSCGFNSVSADIMLGIPNDNLGRIDYFIDTMSKIGVNHISAYMLKIEEGTPFEKMHMDRLCADDDELSDIYEHTVNGLARAGFSQYEISNFSKHAHQSKHNTKYWELDDYIGIGASAHSFIDNKRYSFSPNIEEFMSYKKPFDNMIFEGNGGDFTEFLMLGLRLNKGVSLGKAKKLYPNEDYKGIIDRAKNMEKIGLLNILPCKMFKDEINISLTTKGFLLSNTVISNLLWGC